jgi:hypothetical protein
MTPVRGRGKRACTSDPCTTLSQASFTMSDLPDQTLSDAGGGASARGAEVGAGAVIVRFLPDGIIHTIGPIPRGLAMRLWGKAMECALYRGDWRALQLVSN